MYCPYCGKKIAITHTYRAGTIGKTQTGRCQGCKRVFTVVSVLKEGIGAYKLAKKIELAERLQDAKLKLELKGRTDEEKEEQK
jgi:hypothetical protein